MTDWCSRCRTAVWHVTDEGREETKKKSGKRNTIKIRPFFHQGRKGKRRRFAREHGYYVGSFQLLTAAVKRFHFFFPFLFQIEHAGHNSISNGRHIGRAKKKMIDVRAFFRGRNQTQYIVHCVAALASTYVISRKKC